MKKTVFLYILFIMMLLALVIPAQAQNEQRYFREQLKERILGIGYPMGHSGVFHFLSGVAWNSPGPQFIPIVGLREPNAVPFLINVLQNGPDWPGYKLFRGRADMYPYVARCYAALCLGYIGDSRAFNPLLEILNNKNIETHAHRPGSPRRDEYNLRAYAAFALGYLGDQRAVEPLIKSLREDGFVECIYALTRLQAVTAVPVIVQVASDRNMFVKFSIHNCLEYMLKVRFTSQNAGKVRKYEYQTIDQFPELGIVHIRDKYRILWQHWLKAGDRYAKEQFEEYYPQWKAALKDKPNAHSRHIALKRSMLRGGVATVPYLIAEIEKGDDALIPLVAQVTDPRIPQRKNLKPRLSENATRDEALEWWKKNKKEWTVFQQVFPNK